jgi:hypothetical protein
MNNAFSLPQVRPLPSLGGQAAGLQISREQGVQGEGRVTTWPLSF